MDKKILVVDDSVGVLREMVRILKQTGLEVLTASSGTEAMKLMIREKPILVFLDLMLPEMNGDVVCKFIKGMPEIKCTPVIIVTAAGEQHLQRCFQSGCDAYVIKPVSEDDILQKVKTVFDERDIPVSW